MFPTGSALGERERTQITAALNATVADGVDLYTQLKVAHWNVKGVNFRPLHELFESLADSVSEQNDTLAERAVALGELAIGSARQVAKVSRVAEIAPGTTRDLDLVRALAERFETALAGMRAARTITDEHHDLDSSDLLTAGITAYEKHVWFLRATLG